MNLTPAKAHFWLGVCQHTIISFINPTITSIKILFHTSKYCVIHQNTVSYIKILCHTSKYCVIHQNTVSYIKILCQTSKGKSVNHIIEWAWYKNTFLLDEIGTAKTTNGYKKFLAWKWRQLKIVKETSKNLFSTYMTIKKIFVEYCQNLWKHLFKRLIVSVYT